MTASTGAEAEQRCNAMGGVRSASMPINCNLGFRSYLDDYGLTENEIQNVMLNNRGTWAGRSYIICESKFDIID